MPRENYPIAQFGLAQVRAVSSQVIKSCGSALVLYCLYFYYSGSLSVNLSLIVQDEAQAKIDTALKLQEIRDGLTFPLFAETVSTQNFLVEETPREYAST